MTKANGLYRRNRASWILLAIAAVCASVAGAALPPYVTLSVYDASLYALLLAGTACLWGWFTDWRFAGLLIVPLVLFLVWCCTSWQPRLAAEPAGRDALVEGYVASFPVGAGGVTRFEFLVAGNAESTLGAGRPGSDQSARRPGDAHVASEQASVITAGGFRQARIKLSWYNAPVAIVPGAHWRLRVRLREPRGLANPGGFDYRRALYLKGIAAVGYVRQSGATRTNETELLPVRTSDVPWSIRLLQWRAAVAQRIELAVPAGSRALPLLLALAVGARHRLSDDDWRVLRRTGTSHLLAISGLHITLAAAFGFLLGRGGLLLGAPAFLPWLLGAAMGLLYTVLSGFGLPASRALLMLLLYTALMLGRRDYSGFQLLGFAAVGVVLIEPLAAFQAGFWLSFTAVAVLIHTSRLMGGYVLPQSAGLLLQTDSRSRIAAAVRRGFTAVSAALRMQCVLVATLALPGAWFFGELSLLAPLVNLIAVPAFSVFVIPLLLLSLLLLPVFPEGADLLLRLLANILAQGFECLAVLADTRFAAVSLADAGGIVFLGGAVAIVLMLAPAGVPGRAFALFMLLPLVFGVRAPASDALFVEVLDVGHGLAAIVRAGEHSLLYDTGPGWRGGDAGASVVVPALRQLGVDRPEQLIVSHADSDHAGGLKSLQREFAGLTPLQCEAGQSWRWVWPGSSGAAVFTVLHPGVSHGWSDNNGSCVLHIAYAGQHIVLPGDIEAPAEARLQSLGRLPRADLLLIPHHGSLSSSTPAFVSALQPRFAVASAAWHNHWGFPREQVVARWRAAGACVLSTADTGALRFVVDASGLHLDRVWRRLRWWQLWAWRAAAKNNEKAAAACL